MERVLSFLRNRMGALGWSAFLVFVAMRLGDVANLVNNLILGRILKDQDFGAVVPVFSVVAVLSIPVGIVFQVGMRSISRLHAMGHEDERRTLVQDLSKIALAGAAVSMILVYALKPFIMDRLHLEGGVYIHLLAGLFLLAWIQPMLSAVLQGEHRYGVLVVPSVVSGGAVLIVTWLLVVILSWGLPGALFSRVIANALAAVALFLALRGSFAGERRPYAGELGYMRELLVPMTAYVVGASALVHFDRLLVRNFMVDQSPGYGAVVTLGSIPQYFLGALTFVLFPLAAGEHARGRGLDRYRRKAALVCLVVTGACVLVFALAGRFALRKWNPAFEPFADALWVYAAAMGMHGLIDMLVSIEMARHRHGFLWLFVLPAVGYCVLLYGMRSSLNVMAVVWAGVAARAVVLACLWQYGMGRRGEDDTSENGEPEKQLNRG